MTEEDEYIELSKRLLNRIGRNIFYIQEKDSKSGVLVPWIKQVAQIASDTILLIEKNSFYNACLLSASIVESIIQLSWLDEDIDERCKTYLAFGLIEDLDRIKDHPEEHKETIDCLKMINAERFLRKNVADKTPLNRKNYINNWYNYYNAKNYEDMVKKLNMPHLNHLYKLYCFLCGFKHFEPYKIVRLYDMKNKTLFENPGQKFIAAQTIVYSLIEAINIINKYQENKIYLLDVAQRTTQLMNSNHPSGL